MFSIFFFWCGPIEISLSTNRNVYRGRVACIWISPNPIKAGPTLKEVVVVVVVVIIIIIVVYSCNKAIITQFRRGFGIC